MDYHFEVAGKKHVISITDRGDNKDINVGHPAKYFSPSQLNQTQLYLTSVYDALKPICPLRGKVVEICGGVGTYPMVLWDLMKPTKWTAYDIDPWCGENYQFSRAKMIVKDMTDIPVKDLDAKIVMFDFPSNILTKLIRGTQGLKKTLDHIHEARPQYLLITDVGTYWCHMPNHHPIYMEYFGKIPTRETYHEFMAEYYKKEFGRTLINHTRGGGAGQYLFK